jgi:hypothetical protein
MVFDHSLGRFLVCAYGRAMSVLPHVQGYPSVDLLHGVVGGVGEGFDAAGCVGAGGGGLGGDGALGYHAVGLQEGGAQLH